MEEAEQSVYVAQLKAEFDSCDTASSGFLGPQEVTALCRKLHLDAHLPLMLDSLLGGGGGGGAYARVDFEAFKDNFVEVLSRSLDLTSDDDSSYLQPVVVDEVKPKFTKGQKRYGRRSRPDVTPSQPSAGSPAPGGNAARTSPTGLRGSKVRRAASLDSVESLKSDEEAASPKHGTSADFQPKASKEEGEESGCDHLIGREPGTQVHDNSEQVTLAHFQNLLCGSSPICCSTPHRTLAAPEDGSRPEDHLAHRTSPSLLTATPDPKVLSRLDDGSGCTSPERLVALWTDEGVRNARDILQTLDFPAEERVSLCELTLALDNELLGSGNGIHHVALISYKNEIQHLRECSEQARGERDKAKADLDRAERRNLQLLREADERLAGTEALSRTRIRELEQDFRERLTAQRGQAEQESDAAAQQLEQERRELGRQLSVLEVREAELREELAAAAQEKAHLEEELGDLKHRLSEAENGSQRLRADLKQLLHHKFGGLDDVGAALNPEDQFARLLQDSERQCRELRDKNDELCVELELLRSHKKSHRKSVERVVALSRSEPPSSSESESDDRDMKRRSSSPRRAAVTPDDAMAAVSIETEFAVEKLKAKHKQEIQQLNVQMETQVNYYERSLDRMRQSMEVERKDIAQAFKLEISELEDQKAEAERQAKILKEALDKLHNRLQHGSWSSEMERRMQRERADSEQNFAREIGNLVQRLSTEKDQLEAELKLKMDQEVMNVREEAALELSQMKLHHAEGQRRLLHQVHLQRQRQQQWDKRRQQQLRQQKTCLEREKKKMEERRLQEEELIQQEKRMLEEEKSKMEEEEKKGMEEKEHLRQEMIRMEDQMKKMEERTLEEQKHLREEKRKLEEELRPLREQQEAQDCSRRFQPKQTLQDSEQEVRPEENVSRPRLSRQPLTSRDSFDREEPIWPQKLEDQEVVHPEAQTMNLSREPREWATEPDGLHVGLLQEALKRERAAVSLLRSSLDREKEEVVRLSLEKRGYMTMADQLSAQIVEMEEEMEALQEDTKVGRRAEHVESFESFERDKQKMKKQLLEMENLVVLLQDLDRDHKAPPRTHLEEARSDNAALQERLCVLQQEVDKLDDEVANKRRKLEEMEQHRESSRQEVERLHQEMATYRQEVVSLSGRNAELSAANAELSARLQERQEGHKARVVQLQEEAQLQREQTLRLEEELSGCKRKVSEMEAELSAAVAERQRMKAELRREDALGGDRAEHLPRDAPSSRQDDEKLGHAQEVTDLRRKLQDSHRKAEEMESSNRKLMKDNQEKDTHNQQLFKQVQQLLQDQQKLSKQVARSHMARTQAEGQEGAGLREKAEQLQAQLQEEQRRSLRLEEELHLCARQSSAHISLKEEQHEKALAAAQQKTQELEVKLKASRVVLNEKVQQLQQQMAKNVKSSVMLKELYVENSQLMKTLQQTERRHKNAQQDKMVLEEKVCALNRLLEDIVPAALNV
ncbi:ninein-like protein isoform X2 [Hippocampus comes]|uniref:ninein-like protein isoform X2 n=1 Tax=Hippocampus comes TaxID=109280 RepID=UPI00094E86F9|nr:PREDICTED: ninein-like protein isoform X2 [Hippocampus comes]